MTLLRKSALAIILLTVALAGQPALAYDLSAAGFITRFHKALFSNDLQAVTASFAADAVIFEGGKREPSLEGYLEHHLGPELPMLAGLTREVEVEDLAEVGDVAWYGVQAQLRGFAGEREISITHATTMVFVRVMGGWEIKQIHFSNRRNEPAAADEAADKPE